MKKTSYSIVLASILLAGCSNELNSLIDRIPFIANNSEETEIDEPNEIIDEHPTEVEEQQPNEHKNILTLEEAYFNEIEVVDGIPYIQNPLNIMALVNKEFYLNSEYAPEDLVRPNIPFSFGDEDVEKSYMRQVAGTALEELFAAAELSGIEIFAVSGYRSFERQAVVYDSAVKRDGEEHASHVVALPGTSEHQTGLAMDISSRSVGLALTTDFEETPEGIWLAEIAHQFGFILRYPKGKEEITGYQFEPWHFRYVGKDAAKVIYENDWTLEEYFEVVEKI